MSNSKILNWLEKKAKLVTKSKKKDLKLTEFLQDELKKSVEEDEDVYAVSLTARTFKEKHNAIIEISKNRKKVEKEDLENENEPRKKGYLENKFDTLLSKYIKDPDEVSQIRIMDMIGQFEVNRRVRFLYDLQKLRISAENRKQINKRNFSINDIYLDYSGAVLNKLETYNIKMIDRVIKQSVDGPFYEWLLDNHIGVGPQIGGCLISELSTPERFHTVGNLWSYCGLQVVGNNEKNLGGHAVRREKDKKANWNSFLKSKLVGVLSDIMIKHQTAHLGPDHNRANYDLKMEEYKAGKRKAPPKALQDYDPDKCRNIECLTNYKKRIIQRNERIAESKRFYDTKKKEVFHHRDKQYKGSPIMIDVYDKNGKSKGKMYASKLERRTLAHIQDMSKRYMIKMFLCDILNKWREFKGLEPLLTYDEAKLRGGLKHLETEEERRERV